MRKQISPTRMQVLLLRRQLSLAWRGHKLLKEKLDGLVRQFYAVKNAYLALHKKTEPALVSIFTKSAFAYALTDPSILDILKKSGVAARVETKTKNLMGVKIPSYELKVEGESRPYSRLLSTAELPEAVGSFSRILPELVKLAETGHSLRLIAKQIIETRRRVNALEYVLIPEFKNNLRFISMKLDEIERGRQVALLKIKEIVRAH